MEGAESVEIPQCEICRTTYSAHLKIGNKKVCFKTLFTKMRQLPLNTIAATLLYLAASTYAFYLFATLTFFVIGSIFTSMPSDARLEYLGSDPFSGVFLQVVCPVFMVRAAVTHCKGRMKLWEESMVQIVELTLNPKHTVKQ